MTKKPSSNQLDAQLLKRVLAEAAPYKSLLLSTTLMAILLAPLATIRPWLVQKMVDDHIVYSDVEGLLKLSIIFIIVLFLHAFLTYLFTYLSGVLGQAVVRDLRIKIFNHINRFNLSYFDKTPIGTSTTRTINDVETINTVFSQGVITIIADILTLIVVLAIMFITSWKLTLIALTTSPFLVIASYIFKEKVKTSFQSVRTEISRMNAFLQEQISGMRLVQIFHIEKLSMRRFKTINREYTKANLDSVLYYAVFYPVVEIISAASLGLMVWWGAKGVIGESVSMGALIAFPIYLNMLFNPIRILADKFNTLQMGLVASDRVFALLDNQAEQEVTGHLKPEKLIGEVVFNKVNFAYQGEDWVLKNVDFQIKPGETLAIVGATGSGKTSIISLINRFYTHQSGLISIDGTDIKDFDLQALRHKMALVLQDVFLFSGSVFENITLRDESISREKVLSAAKMIGAHEFIEKLPGGYDYQVMERGATLSMGQRQLISFVRALVFEPDILILDEATSSIDPASESVIQKAIETLIAQRTSIIIAHRLSTIMHAHKILVMQRGEVMESGSPEDLLKNEEGLFRKLHDMQFIQIESMVTST
ncbi:MAG: ABC transporter ATP-binding protein/permease [Saprospiraceae bacterium]|nr:ABC transporter ATP-binding protein/permease [Saprospiraceae bacterium]MDP4700513.1 ABC transporter ATP-binding protein/permease [Saprospiraceae bacterium]MDP4810178.1 ABC transporter ATP-binding protein/permease [Saprospiraceae bacterium]MDP4814400.1 ABC transporter ATP-binding protein/permease [Saprospiraceae bacterium]MDP4852307.1 ABC transporter ATP-binding protein/permease [Saprospiraceae bacterium]